MDFFQIDWPANASSLLAGLRRTLLFTATGFTLATLLAVVVALMRVSGVRALRWVAIAYTETFKNIPLIAIIYLVYFGLATDPLDITLSEIQGGTIALTVFYAAYLAEIFRSAILGVHGGQAEAAQALGLGRVATFRRVILPQAVRLALPGMNTMLVDLLKGTSLLVVIGAGELMTQGSIIRSRTFRALEVFTVIGALYFALCYPLSQSLLWFERRIAAGRPITIGRRRRLAAARIALPEPPDNEADDGEPGSLEAVGS